MTIMVVGDGKDDFFEHLDHLDDESTISEDDRSFTNRPVKIRKIEREKTTPLPVVHTPRIDHEALSASRTDVLKRAQAFSRAETDTQNLKSKRAKLSQENRRIRRTNSEPKPATTLSASTSATEALFRGCNFCRSASKLMH